MSAYICERHTFSHSLEFISQFESIEKLRIVESLNRKLKAFVSIEFLSALLDGYINASCIIAAASFVSGFNFSLTITHYCKIETS